MYYNELVKELVKVFTKESEQIGKAVQINIIHSLTRTDFIFHQENYCQWENRGKTCFPLELRNNNGQATGGSVQDF